MVWIRDLYRVVIAKPSPCDHIRDNKWWLGRSQKDATTPATSLRRPSPVKRYTTRYTRYVETNCQDDPNIWGQHDIRHFANCRVKPCIVVLLERTKMHQNRNLREDCARYLCLVLGTLPWDLMAAVEKNAMMMLVS